jgi:hypothetical protein
MQEGTKPLQGPPAKKKSERVTFSSELFRAKDDHLGTVKELATRFLADLRRAERKASETKEAAKSFPSALAALEKQTLAQFDRLADEIREDKLLSDVGGLGDERSERDAVLDAVAKQTKKVRALVKEAREKHEQNQANEEPW